MTGEVCQCISHRCFVFRVLCDYFLPCQGGQLVKLVKFGMRLLFQPNFIYSMSLHLNFGSYRAEFLTKLENV